MVSHGFQFTKANRNRKPEFRTKIRVCEVNQKKTLIKSADSPEAFEFLRKIIEKEQISKSFFRHNAEVVTGTLKGENIHYPYLNYPTLEELIGQAIKDGDSDFGAGLIREYLGLLQKLPSQRCRPEAFMKEFENHSGSSTKELHCLIVGPIDSIPCNILVNPKSWHILDHEWTYEFPTPSAFVAYRGIYSLVIRLQKLIQSQVSREHPVSLFCGYGNNRTYIPIGWLDLLLSMEIPLEKMSYWEWVFQRKIRINARMGRLRLKKKPKMLCSVKKSPFFVLSLIWIYRTLRRKCMRNAY